MRTAVGFIACALYAWRVYDPKGSYAVFYDVSNWLTGWLLTGGGVMAVLRNMVNLILLDQAEGFLLGIVFLALLQAPIWAVRKGTGWCWRGLRRWRRQGWGRQGWQRRAAPEDEPLLLVPAGIEGRASGGPRDNGQPPAA